ncbi:hypothetical protein, partial [Psychroflexus sp. MES1-P1E]|uniref:hypothetical protein n=1 Tax=Psychroflexus sp. MES1-P1E TaxID=2058320 RepID=UPI000CBD5425
ILFSKIFFNLNGSKSDLSTKERNKALRPIFIKLILKPIFQESYHLGEDDPKVVRKLNDTIKYLESIPYKKN